MQKKIKIDNNFVIGIILIIIGIVCMLDVLKYMNANKEITVNNSFTYATISNINERKNEYEYTFLLGNNPYPGTTKITNGSKYNINDTIRIYYNPNNPLENNIYEVNYIKYGIVFCIGFISFGVGIGLVNIAENEFHIFKNKNIRTENPYENYDYGASDWQNLLSSRREEDLKHASMWENSINNKKFDTKQ